MSFSLHIVVARYNEPLDWLRPVWKSCVVYNKGSPLQEPADAFLEVKDVPNVGRESETYFRYILDHYTCLPDIVVFTQGNISDHRSGGLQHLLSLAGQASSQGKAFPVSSHPIPYSWNQDCQDEALPQTYKEGMDRFGDWFQRNIRSSYPPVFHLWSNAIFAVQKKLILRHPRETYERLLGLCNYHRNPIEAHYFERSWYYIFDETSDCGLLPGKKRESSVIMNVEHAIETYTEEKETDLCRMCNEFGSDKGSAYHQFSRFYKVLFEPIRSESFCFFELGLGTNDTSLPSNMGETGKPGASLRAWKQFFPTAQIYGADIDRKILFEEDRIKTFYCDQTNPTDIAAMWNSEDLKDKQFRVILEDGLHTLESLKVFFEESVHKLEPGGVFLSEDLGMGNPLPPLRELLCEWQVKYPSFTFDLVYIKTVGEQPGDNWILVAQRGSF